MFLILLEATFVFENSGRFWPNHFMILAENDEKPLVTLIPLIHSPSENLFTMTWSEVSKARSENRRELVLTGKPLSAYLTASEGQIDPNLFALTSLNFLDLSSCPELKGALPEAIGNLANLTTLLINGNAIEEISGEKTGCFACLIFTARARMWCMCLQKYALKMLCYSVMNWIMS